MILVAAVAAISFMISASLPVIKAPAICMDSSPDIKGVKASTATSIIILAASATLPAIKFMTTSPRERGKPAAETNA